MILVKFAGFTKRFGWNALNLKPTTSLNYPVVGFQWFFIQDHVSLLRCPGTAIYTISTGASAEGRRFCSILPAIDTKWYKNQPSWKSGIMSLMAHSTLDSWLLYAWAKRPMAKNEVPSGGMIPPPPAGQPPAPPPPPSDVVGHLRKTYTLED